jgi:hypothetical protein
MVINVHNKNIINVKQIAESAFCSNGSLSSVTLVFSPSGKQVSPIDTLPSRSSQLYTLKERITLKQNKLT